MRRRRRLEEGGSMFQLQQEPRETESSDEPSEPSTVDYSPSGSDLGDDDDSQTEVLELVEPEEPPDSCSCSCSLGDTTNKPGVRWPHEPR